MSRFCLFLSCLLFATITLAQDASTGAIRGTVSDTAGARVAAATVAMVSVATDIRYFSTTDREGRFAFDLLPPGDYLGRVEAPGMSPQVTPRLHVELGGVTQLEFKLAVAGTKETITVSGEPQLIETQPSAVSTVIDERAINELPLNGRRFTDLALLTPGVTQDPRGLTSSSNGDLAFGGIRGYQSSYLVDGADNNNAFFAQARGRYRAPLSVLERGSAGVPRVLEYLRRRTRARRRRGRQRRHQVRLQSPSRYRLLFSARQRLQRPPSLHGLQAQ
jgi:hypothetical protein